MKKRAHVLISGRVQGVWFRSSTKNIAEQFDLTGWVKNTSDGKVEAIFEGEEDNIIQMIKWCHKGPVNAKVDNIDIKYENFSGNFPYILFDIIS